MGLLEIIVSIALASVLAGFVIASLLRKTCNTATRVVFRIVGGICCLFLLGVVAFVWTITKSEPSKPMNANNYTGPLPQQQPQPQRGTDALPPETTASDSYEATTGSISLPYKGKVELNLRKEDEQDRNRYTSYNGENGSVVVPAGQYFLANYTLMTDDKNGIPVYLYGSRNPDLPNTSFAIVAGKTHKLKFGPPFTAWVDVKQKNNQVYMDFKMVGRNSEKCIIQTDKAPGFQILSQSGKILQSGSFEYG
jgi:hypothetical protein